MAEAEGAGAAPAQRVCASDALAERGRGVSFDVQLWGRPVRAFALRIDGRPVAYVNRCVHVPTELDWQPGEFLDADRRDIVCSVHGATYDAGTGRCLGGPCGRGRLLPVAVDERDGVVHWYPSADLRPVPTAPPPLQPDEGSR